MTKQQRRFIAGLCVTLALIGLLALLVRSRYAQPVGKLQLVNNQALMDRAASFLGSKFDMKCAGQLHGFDNKYLYTNVACATFEHQHTPQAVVATKYFDHLRFEYKPDGTIVGFKAASVEMEGSADLPALFPKPAYLATKSFERSGGYNMLLSRLIITAQR